MTGSSGLVLRRCAINSSPLDSCRVEPATLHRKSATTTSKSCPSARPKPSSASVAISTSCPALASAACSALGTLLSSSIISILATDSSSIAVDRQHNAKDGASARSGLELQCPAVLVDNPGRDWQA